MPHDNGTPAIRRQWQFEDSNTEVISTLDDSVTFHRGLGDSGSKIEIVEHDCPECSYDRMVRYTRVFPDERDTVEYYCQRPTCPYHVGDEFSYARPTIGPNFPIIWSQTAFCPDCDDRHTVTVDQRPLSRQEFDAFHRDDYRHEALCDTCIADRAERRDGV